MINKYKELLKEVSKEHNEVKNESLNDRVLIIDGLNQFIRVFGAVPALNDDGEHCGGVTGFLLSTAATSHQELQSLEHNPSAVEIA